MERVADSELPTAGDVLAGKYRLEGIIGRGGMGVVFAAQHVVLGQRVAVKVLAEVNEPGSKARERFVHEARAAARIESEHVARVVDAGTTDRGAPFMVMELLEGSDLATLASRERLPLRDVIDYVLQALEGIAHAHAAGIVHRDLKPANLFLARRPDGTSRIKILDFGISKATNAFAAPSSMTTTSALLGSPYYMSPEQIRSARTVDARADIWAIGVMLHELLTGKVPFEGETVGELFAAILEQPPTPLRALRADAPEELERTVLRCLAQRADARFPHVAELAEALAPFGSAGSAAMVAAIRAALGDAANAARVSAPPPSTVSAAPAVVALGAQTASSWADDRRQGSSDLRARVSYAAGGALVAAMGLAAFALFGGRNEAPPKRAPAAAPPPVASVVPSTPVSASATALASAPPVPSSVPSLSPAPPPAKPPRSAPAPAPYNPLRDRRR
jgi:serine/threonine protein kinase